MSERGPVRRSRRSVLAAATGTAGVAGTVGVIAGRDRIRVLAAASLAALLEDSVGPAFQEATGVRVDGEYLGTSAILRLVSRGDRRPDVVIGADAPAHREHLEPAHAAWTLEVATNELVIAYAPETTLGSALASGAAWPDQLATADSGAIGISDPAHHPLGVRAIQLFELAERYYDRAGFQAAVLARTNTDGREGQLLGGLEAGNRACVVCYRNMARNWAVPFVDLPAALSFGSPAHEASYQRATAELADGDAVTGSLASYAASVPREAAAGDDGERFVHFLVDTPTLLEAGGLAVPDSFPRATGRVPEAIRS